MGSGHTHAVGPAITVASSTTTTPSRMPRCLPPAVAMVRGAWHPIPGIATTQTAPAAVITVYYAEGYGVWTGTLCLTRASSGNFICAHANLRLQIPCCVWCFGSGPLSQASSPRSFS